MNKDLFLAVLAMDSYNRGYDPGVVISTTALGNASKLNIDIPAGGQAAGFYAIAYNVGSVAGFSAGEKVISYRGTNTVPFDALSADIIDGWTVGTGSPAELQAKLATQFFNSVNGAGDPRLANITLTGHSLGGGLAGLVGTLYGLKGVLFDHMPFEVAALTTYADALLDGSLRTLVYGSRTPWLGSSANLHGYATEDEILSNLRAVIATLSPQELSTYGADFPNLPLGAAVNRHSQALLVTLMYGQKTWEAPTGQGGLNRGISWREAARYFLPALFNDAIAGAVGFAQVHGVAGPSAKLQTAIAYSAISEGERPFGDTGIVALFDDATDLGKALGVAGVSEALRRSGDAIGQSLVQFAGQLALGDVEGDAVAKLGIVTVDAGLNTLAVDYSAALWAKGADSTRIVGREALLTAALARITLKPSGSVLPGVPQGFVPVSDIAAGLRWYQAAKGIALATPSELVDRVEFQIRAGAFNGTLSARSTSAAANRLTAFVAGNGADRITGSASDDLIFGSDGLLAESPRLANDNFTARAAA